MKKEEKERLFKYYLRKRSLESFDFIATLIFLIYFWINSFFIAFVLLLAIYITTGLYESYKNGEIEKIVFGIELLYYDLKKTVKKV